jgi:glycosyltransferase involved in cell wall biosynthesis
LHLVALVDSPDHVCCRYRLRAFVDTFAAAGHSLQLRKLPRDWWGRLRLGHDLAGADVVIVLRRLLPVWCVRLLRRRVRRLVFDFDDAVFLRDSFSGQGLHSPRRRRRFVQIVRASDAIVAGNTWLLERAREAGGGGRRVVVPTCVDPTRYPLARHESAGPGVRLVWVGSASTLQGMERVLPLWEAIGKGVPGVRLKLICDQFLALRHLPVERCAWSEPAEPAEIAAADIGVSWLPDDDWSRGKCGLKVLQYMAAGLPVVANPVGVQADLVRCGETGFLASTAQEWVEAVSRLAADPQLRRRFGEAGRQRVERDFGVALGGDRWRALLAALDRSNRIAG